LATEENGSTDENWREDQRRGRSDISADIWRRQHKTGLAGDERFVAYTPLTETGPKSIEYRPTAYSSE